MDLSDENKNDVDASLRVMSFNLRYDNITAERAAAVIAEIKNYNPDVFGVQEDTAQWSAKLEEVFPEYTPVRYTYDSDTGSEEYETLYFRTADFKSVESGTKWFSETPDVRSSLSGANKVRKMNYAVLTRTSDSKTFCFANTHLDNAGEDSTKWESLATVRKQQAEILIAQLKEISQAHGNIPVIVVGDFNTTPDGLPEQYDDGVYGTVTAEVFADSRVAASSATNRNHATYNSAYGTTNAPSADSTILDYCFVSKDTVTVQNYCVDIGMYHNMYPSDHFPIIVDLQFQ